MELPGVIVLSDLGLRKLMHRALQKVPKNYGAEDYLIKAYHRSYFATNAGFAQLNEGYLTIRDTPYSGTNFRDRKRNQTWVDQLRVKNGTEAVPPQIRKFFDRQGFMTGGYDWLGNPVYFQSPGNFLGIEGGEDLHHLTFQQVGEYFDGRDTLLRIRYTIDSLVHARERPAIIPVRVIILGKP